MKTCICKFEREKIVLKNELIKHKKHQKHILKIFQLMGLSLVDVMWMMLLLHLIQVQLIISRY